jgi:putative alpha-1,2-mannosidase
LSSWYVWAGLGLFPIAGQSLYLLNAPSYAQSRIRLGAEELAVETTGFVEPTRDGPVQYVQSVTFDGRPVEQSWLPARDLHRGGRLVVELGPRPSAWGTTSRPPSSSTSRGSAATPHPAR